MSKVAKLAYIIGCSVFLWLIIIAGFKAAFG
jgi:hypothetical protein